MTHPLIIHLLAQRAALRTALERAKRLSIAGNGFAEASQSLSDDDRMEEKTAAMLAAAEYQDRERALRTHDGRAEQ